MPDSNLEKSLIEVIGHTGIYDMLSDAGEMKLDTLLSDGVIKDVPVLGTLAKLYKTGVSVKGYLFIKKLNRFLRELDKVPVKEREEFVEKCG